MLVPCPPSATTGPFCLLPPYARVFGRGRTLHQAEAAVDEKWVTQQWVARGFPANEPAPSPAAPEPASLSLVEAMAAAGADGKRKKKGNKKTGKKGAQPPAKGFGRK
eukprot:1389411-Pyramimonas_sp.AAC.1